MDQTAANFWIAVDCAGDGGCPHCDIATHPAMASAARMALVATGVLPSAGVPLLTMATPTAYARLAYLTYYCWSCTASFTGFCPSNLQGCWATNLHRFC